MNMNICVLINQLFLSYFFFIVTEHVKSKFDTYLPFYFDLYTFFMSNVSVILLYFVSSLGPDLSSIA